MSSDKLINTLNIKNETPLAYVRTYGCQQNFSDSEKIKGILKKMGFGFTDSIKKARLILFNTCAVREHAEDRVFGNIGALKHIKKENPDVIIALCGCMMQQKHIQDKIKTSFPFVDLVFGTNMLSNFSELLYGALNNKKKFLIGQENQDDYESLPNYRENKFQAWVPIMYGCNNFCSYCIVPYVRGRERSRKADKIINEVNHLISLGYKEINLLGQNVNSYGKNLESNINFAELLKELDSIQGDFWIRFMTSHPKDITKDLIDVIANGRHICKHIHLPVQAGNNRILKLMNRKYTRETYLSLVQDIKKNIPNVTLTSDIIVGFPGETYEDFQDTLYLVKQVEFLFLYNFIYSKRKGTPAVAMEDIITHEEKVKWFKELLKVQEIISERIYGKLHGEVIKVLVEKEDKEKGYLMGRTETNITVRFKGSSDLIGRFVKVKIKDSNRLLLLAEVQ